MILRCKCKNGYQDKTYGFQNRVHTLCKSKQTGDFTAARCVVCGVIKEVGKKG